MREEQLLNLTWYWFVELINDDLHIKLLLGCKEGYKKTDMRWHSLSITRLRGYRLCKWDNNLKMYAVS